MYLRRVTALLSMITMIVMTGATPAEAGTGDSASDPVPLASSLPQTIRVDTTSATAEPDDPSQSCAGWGPSELRLDATTFYSYTAATNTVLVSEARSPGGTAPHASVYTYDSSGALVQWGCSNGQPDRLILSAGRKYLIMMGTCCEPQGVNGGLADLSLTEQPPLLDIDVHVTQAFVEKATGRFIINGMITCNTVVNSPGTRVSGELRQQTGRTDRIVVAQINDGFGCDPSAPTPWTLVGGPASGAFSPGKARLTLSWRGSDNFTTDSGVIDIDVHLTPYRP